MRLEVDFNIQRISCLINFTYILPSTTPTLSSVCYVILYYFYSTTAKTAIVSLINLFFMRE